MNKQPFQSKHGTDAKGNPAGGSTDGIGLWIHWQDGPLGRGAVRQEPNGCFVETVIRAAVDRLEFYQMSPYFCLENALAIANLHAALDVLQARTEARERRQVEGTHEP